MNPPIMMNVHSVRVTKLALFFTFSLSSGCCCFSGGFSMSVLRDPRASFSDAADGKLARAGGFESAGTGACRADCAGTSVAATEGSCEGAEDAEPFTFGDECAVPFARFGGATFVSGGTSSASSAGETSNASAITGDAATGGVASCDVVGVSAGGRTAGCTSPPAAFCALAAARAAFSSWRFSKRANAFCFLSALLDSFALDSFALR